MIKAKQIFAFKKKSPKAVLNQDFKTTGKSLHIIPFEFEFIISIPLDLLNRVEELCEFLVVFGNFPF